MKLLDVLFLVHKETDVEGLGLCPKHNIQVCDTDRDLSWTMACRNCPLTHKRSYHNGQHIVRELTGIQFDNQIE